MGRTLVWGALAVIGLIFVGWLVLSLLGTVLKFAFYLLVGAAVVGGAYFLFTRARGSLGGGKRRQIR